MNHTDMQTFNMFWHGGELSPLGHACAESFVRRGHRVRLFSYGALEAPAGVDLADAAEVIPASDPIYETCANRNVVAFADCFRYRLLYQRGGWWVDTDVYCLSEDVPQVDHAWAEQEAGVINNAILRFPKGDGLCERLVARSQEEARTITRWGATGPDLMTEVAGAAQDVRAFGSQTTFYPLHWREAHLLWLPRHHDEVLRRTVGALFLHCWAKAMHDMGIDATRQAPSGSYLATMLGAGTKARPLSLWQRLQTEQRIRRFHGPAYAKRGHPPGTPEPS